MNATVIPISPRAEGAEVAAELDAIHARLGQLAGCAPPEPIAPGDVPAPFVFQLARRLALGVPERRAVLFATAAELCGTTAELVARLGAGPPSIGLLLRVCDGLDFQALRPDGALRRARLLALGNPPEGRFTERPVWVEEPVLHYLHGVVQLAPDLTALSLPFASSRAVPTDEATVRGIAAHVSAATSPFGLQPIELACDDVAEAVAHAIAGLRSGGYGALVVSAARLPAAAAELDALRNAWLRDSLLHDLGLVIVCDRRTGAAEPSQLLGWAGPVIVIGLDGQPGLIGAWRCVVRHDQNVQLGAWHAALSEQDRKRHGACLDRLAARFRLSTPIIADLATKHGSGESGSLWRAAREAAHPSGLELVERIEPVVLLERVVLPPDARRTIEVMIAAARVHHRIRADWSEVLAGGRGLGIAALFSGDSGTGKTMAAEAVARELELDLYRVEVSAVISKYIGETEKNLRRIFAAAEAGGAVLLFDEADILFGKRNEAHDAHDRYANMEVGYLLQLMESFSGLAILTTNFRQALDEAFTRRLRFVVEFPMPGVEQRLRIWRGAFPPRVEVKGVDFARLARLPLSGGIIRNVALGAAFRAAAEGSAVSMVQVLDAARAEYVKLGRPRAEIDAKDWS